MKEAGWIIEELNDIQIATIPDLDPRLKLAYGKHSVKKIPLFLEMMKNDIGSQFDLDIKRLILLRGKTEKPIFGDIRLIAKNEGYELIEYSDIQHDPTYEEIDMAVETLSKVDAQLIIAVGGGSVIDASKAIAYRIFGEGKKHDTKPLITIPTTSGAGSELNSWAVIKNSVTKCKESSQWALPYMTILDPFSFVSLPERLTFITGMDAFVQSIEGYVSINAGEITRKGSMEGAWLVKHSLASVLEDGKNLDFRAKMSLGSAMGGVSMSYAGLGIPHGIANQISQVPHGLIVSIIFPEAMSYSIKRCNNDYLHRYIEVANVIFPEEKLVDYIDSNGKISDENREILSQKLPQLIRDWIWKDLNGTKYIKEQEISTLRKMMNEVGGYKKDETYGKMIKSVLENVNTKSDPVFAIDEIEVTGSMSDPALSELDTGNIDGISGAMFPESVYKKPTERINREDVVTIIRNAIKDFLSYIDRETFTRGMSITGKALVIDVEKQEHKVISWVDYIRSKYNREPALREMIGGFARGLNYFLDTSPDSFSERLVLSTGFLTGSSKFKMLLSANRLAMVFRSPLKEKNGKYGICWSSVGSDTGIEIKKLGVDDIVINGKSNSPVSILINAGDDGINVDFKDENPETTTFQTVDHIKEKYEYEFAGVVGPSAFNNVHFAGVHFAVPGKENLRVAARGGPGLVMTSKNIKAVAFKGKEDRFPRPSESSHQLTKMINREIATSPGTQWTKDGTMGATLDLLLPINSMPSYNFSRFIGDDHEKIDDIWKSKLESRGWKFTDDACGACALRCEEKSTTPDGIKLPRVEYESLNYLGPNLGIFDLKTITHANHLCDTLGLDTMTTGAVIGMLFDHNKGEGKEPTFAPDPETLYRLIEDIARRKGVGNILADGIKTASEKLACRELAVHYKGIPYAAYTPINLGSPFSIRGDHVGSRTYFWWLEMEDPRDPDEWVKFTMDKFADTMILQSVGGCWFAGAVLLENMKDLAGELLKCDVPIADIKKAGLSVYIMARMIDNTAGFDSSDDILPDKAYNEEMIPDSVRDKFKLTEELAGEVKRRFYKQMGSDSNGMIDLETLKKWGMEELEKYV